MQAADVSASKSTFSVCSSADDGGSIYARSTAAVDGCVFFNSSASGSGAAIALDPTVPPPPDPQYLVRVTNSLFSSGSSVKVLRRLTQLCKL